MRAGKAELICPYGFEEQGGHCGACGIDDCPFSEEDDSPDSLQGDVE